MEASSVMVTANSRLVLTQSHLPHSSTRAFHNSSLSSPNKLQQQQQKIIGLLTHNTEKLRSVVKRSPPSCRALKTIISCSGAIKEIDESQFSEVVLKCERPVLVEFVANWCGPCRLVAPSIDAIAQEYKERITVVKIDHDANPNLIKDYEVYGLPTLIFFRNGKPVPDSKREGAITKAKLKEYVDGLLESLPVA